MNVGSGQQYIVRGDIHYGDTYDVEVSDSYSPSDEMFEGNGPGRVLAILGSVMALAGVAIWMAMIFSAFDNGPDDPTPFDQRFAGIPVMVIGFGLFLSGGILSGIGAGMSKSSRKREERARRQPRRSR